VADRTRVRPLLRFLAALVLVAGLSITTSLLVDAHAHRRAEQARAALEAGAFCGDVVAVAGRLADQSSVGAAQAACEARGETVVLNFSSGFSLNYLVTVTLSADGRVASVSDVGAW
jgi:hypothetical protein